MFQEINKTNHPPEFSTFIWDGECKFCKWWKDRWEHRIKGQVQFRTYQDAHLEFLDIPKEEFQKASRLIDTNGNVYSGPDSAYKLYSYLGKTKWNLWYKQKRWFKTLSKYGYNHIAKNRNFYYKLTLVLFGSDPTKPKLYWFYYVLLLILLLISL